MGKLDSTMEWVTGTRAPKVMPLQKRSASPRRERRVVVHVETSDAEYISDTSSDCSAVAAKKVQFEQPSTLKSALKKDSAQTKATDVRAKTERKNQSKLEAGESESIVGGSTCCTCSSYQGEDCLKANDEFEPSKSRNKPMSQKINHSTTRKVKSSTQRSQEKIKSDEWQDTHDDCYHQPPKSESKCKQPLKNKHKMVHQCNDGYNSTNWIQVGLQEPDKRDQGQRVYHTRSKMVAKIIQPFRGDVVMREDVIESPTDPRPNAFFDAKTGALRVYHGPIYGNPYASLVPKPPMPIDTFSHGGQFPVPPAVPSPSQQFQPPQQCSFSTTCSNACQKKHSPGNNSWIELTTQEADNMPGAWPNDDNSRGFGWNDNILRNPDNWASGNVKSPNGNSNNNHQKSFGWGNQNNDSWSSQRPTARDNRNTPGGSVNNQSNSNKCHENDCSSRSNKESSWRDYNSQPSNNCSSWNWNTANPNAASGSGENSWEKSQNLNNISGASSWGNNAANGTQNTTNDSHEKNDSGWGNTQNDIFNNDNTPGWGRSQETDEKPNDNSSGWGDNQSRNDKSNDNTGWGESNNESSTFWGNASGDNANNQMNNNGDSEPWGTADCPPAWEVNAANSTNPGGNSPVDGKGNSTQDQRSGNNTFQGEWRDGGFVSSWDKSDNNTSSRPWGVETALSGGSWAAGGTGPIMTENLSGW